MLLYFPYAADRKSCYSYTLKNPRVGNSEKQFKEVIVLEIVIVAIGAMIIGVAIGFSIGKAKYYQWPIGDLRVDQSDPDSPPQLFLELDKDVPAVMTKKYVAFRVKVEDFIPHE